MPIVSYLSHAAKSGGKMREFRITPDSSASELASFALAPHNLTRLPITMRSLNKQGKAYRQKSSKTSMNPRHRHVNMKKG